MGRIGLVHLEAISKAPGVMPVIISNPTISKAEVGRRDVTSFGENLKCSHHMSLVRHHLTLLPKCLDAV